MLTFVVEWGTNEAIVEALFDSPNTVKSHVALLLHQLQADNRTQLAATASQYQIPLGHDPDECLLHRDSTHRADQREKELRS